LSSQLLPNDRLRTQAEKMQPSIDKANTVPYAGLNPTRKRLQAQESKAREAERLEKIQAAMVKLAELLESGTDPGVLSHVTLKAQVELIYYGYWPKEDSDNRKLLKACHITNEPAFRRAHEELKALVSKVGPSQEERELARMLRELHGLKIPGYFATLPELAEDLVTFACIEDHHTVLEPSAGSGSIADVIRQRHPRAELSICEINPRLADILRKKRYRLRSSNFYDLTEKFDRIVMNPPFENLQDVEHVTVCYERLLKPGGRLVAVMSPAFTFRKEAKAAKFRELLKELYVTPVDNPEGSFKQSGTNVHSKTVILNKPLET
jgi:SAM-dependent methyltransferase